MATAREILGSDSVNKTTDLFACADRVSPGDEPRDITSIKHLYIPFNISNEAVHVRRNPFGAQIYRTKIASGNIYHSFDGRRLVIEVGCHTIVYVLINQSIPSKHHRIFIQSENAFSGDTTIRRDAAIIARNTRHVETIVKYEMFFIMGVVSTASAAAWTMVTGSDITFMYARNRKVAGAAKELVATLSEELEQIKQYAPTLHTKIIELILAEGQNNALGAIKKLPKTIVADEQTQAQVAGIIFGKWALPNGNPFSIWTVIGVVLSQAATKSVTKYGSAYLTSLDARYKPLITDMKSIDPKRPASIQKPAQGLTLLMKEAGVSVSQTEASKILTEVTGNKEKAYKNIKNIVEAIDKFRKATGK
ncbi:MAG: hypothetical protein KTR16_15380 [Acidiferrobacterales bacterium]|nr:hypothetical protein [Acidiferrobacterales bacterium]